MKLFCVVCILYGALVSILFIIIIVIITIVVVHSIRFTFCYFILEKVRRRKCFQLESRNIFSSISHSRQKLAFSFSIALCKHQHWILLKLLPHSKKLFFYWKTAISNITLYANLKWKFNFSICKHLINFCVKILENMFN